MDVNDGKLQTITGASGVLMGLGAVMFAFFPFLLPILILVLVAGIPLVLPLALIGLLFVLFKLLARVRPPRPPVRRERPPARKHQPARHA